MTLNEKIIILLDRKLLCPVPLLVVAREVGPSELAEKPNTPVIEVNHVIQSLLIRIEGLEKRCEVLVEMKDHLKNIGVETPTIKRYDEKYENEWYKYMHFQKLADQK